MIELYTLNIGIHLSGNFLKFSEKKGKKVLTSGMRVWYYY